MAARTSGRFRAISGRLAPAGQLRYCVAVLAVRRLPQPASMATTAVKALGAHPLPCMRWLKAISSCCIKPTGGAPWCNGKSTCTHGVHVRDRFPQHITADGWRTFDDAQACGQLLALPAVMLEPVWAADRQRCDVGASRSEHTDGGVQTLATAELECRGLLKAPVLVQQSYNLCEMRVMPKPVVKRGQRWKTGQVGCGCLLDRQQSCDPRCC